LLEQAGISADTITTFASLEAACKKIHNPANGIYAWGANGPDAHRLYKKILPFFWSFGGDILTADGKPTLAKQENITALEQYTRLAETGLIETQRQLDEAFAQGKIAFWLSGSWLTEKIALSSAPIQYGVVPMPSGIAGKPGLSFAGGEYIAITENSKHPLSKTFVQFLTTHSATASFATAISMFPADSALRSTMQTTDPLRVAFAQQLQAARMTPSHPKWLDIEQLLETATEEALYKKKTPTEALQYAQQEALKLLNK
jgi:ABC-type glycerol-3-phosphate transport system substrate-binding protein